jgi:hypothetical protein
MGMANQANETYADTGSVKQALISGAIEGGPEMLLQRIGLGGMERLLAGNPTRAGFKAALKDAAKGAGEEIGGEVFTETGHAGREYLAGENPKALNLDVWADRMYDTALQAGLMSGVSSAPQLAGAAVDRLSRSQRARELGVERTQLPPEEMSAEGRPQVNAPSANPIVEAQQEEPVNIPPEQAPLAIAQEMQGNGLPEGRMVIGPDGLARTIDAHRAEFGDAVDGAPPNVVQSQLEDVANAERTAGQEPVAQPPEPAAAVEPGPADQAGAVEEFQAAPSGDSQGTPRDVLGYSQEGHGTVAWVADNYDRLFERFTKQARKRGLNQQAAEDVAADKLAKLIDPEQANKTRLEEAEKLLATSVTRGAIDVLRKAGRHGRIEADVQQIAAKSAPSAEAQAIDKEESLRVYRNATPEQKAKMANDEDFAVESEKQVEEMTEPERVQKQGMFGGLGLRAPIAEHENLPPNLAAPAGAEERIQAARGMKREGLGSKVSTFFSALYQSFARSSAAPHLEKNTQNSSALEGLRLFKDIPKVAQDTEARVIRDRIMTPTVNGVKRAMNPQQQALFERTLLIQNAHEASKNEKLVPFGFKSANELGQYRSQLEAAAAADPAVAEAIRVREAERMKMLDELDSLGVLPKEKAQKEAYWHQQVFMRMQMQNMGSKGGLNKTKKSFQKGRVEADTETQRSQELDYNTNFIEAEMAWRTDARVQIEKAKLLKEFIDKPYNLIKALKAEAKAKGVKDWETLIPKGHRIWQPEPGNHWYAGYTVADQVAEAALAQQLATIKAEDVREAFLRGAAKEQMVLPDAIVDQLESMKKPLNQPLYTEVLGKMSSGALGLWKSAMLFSPTRAPAYMLRNFFSDMDIAIAGLPTASASAARYAGELADYYRGTKVNLSKEVRLARDLGVIDSGMTAEEIPDIKDIPILTQFFRNPESKGVVAAYMQPVRTFNAWRESLLRMGAFVEYRKQLQEHQRSGKPVHFGGANPAQVKALLKQHGVDVAAAHLARNLMGDYGNLSVAGDWIKKHAVPFYSYMEISTTRYPKLAVNAFRAGDYRRSAAIGAVGSAALGARLLSMYVAIALYNNIFWKKEEEEAPGYVKQNPHLILGRREDGTIRFLNNVGALGDFLEWFGLNEAPALARKYNDGRISGVDALKEMAKAPLNKAAQAIRPEIKTGFEVASGKSLFPDVTSPRSIDRDYAIAGAAGLGEEYRAVKGRLMKTGERERPHYKEKFLGFGSTHPGQTAISDMYDLIEEYKKRKGQSIPEVVAGPFSRVRRAAMDNNYEAFSEAMNVFMDTKKGKPAKDIRTAIKQGIENTNPVARLGKKDERAFIAGLTGTEREKYDRAVKYSSELTSRLSSFVRRWTSERGTSQKTR